MVDHLLLTALGTLISGTMLISVLASVPYAMASIRAARAIDEHRDALR